MNEEKRYENQEIPHFLSNREKLSPNYVHKLPLPPSTVIGSLPRSAWLLGLLRQFDVPHVSIVCTHGLFAGASMERICSSPEVREIVTTDTTPVTTYTHEKFHVASIAPLLAEAIFRIHNGESISGLFVP